MFLKTQCLTNLHNSFQLILSSSKYACSHNPLQQWAFCDAADDYPHTYLFLVISGWFIVATLQAKSRIYFLQKKFLLIFILKNCFQLLYTLSLALVIPYTENKTSLFLLNMFIYFVNLQYTQIQSHLLIFLFSGFTSSVHKHAKSHQSIIKY